MSVKRVCIPVNGEIIEYMGYYGYMAFGVRVKKCLRYPGG